MTEQPLVQRSEIAEELAALKPPARAPASACTWARTAR